MAHRSFLKRLLTLLLAACLTFSALPGAVFASGAPVFRKIYAPEELVSGQYVLISEFGSAPLLFSGGEEVWISTAQPAVDGDTVTDPKGAVWTLTVTDSGVILRDSGGTAVSPTADGRNGIAAGEYPWQVSCSGGSFSFHGISADVPVTLAQNATDGFRAYKDSTLNGLSSTYYSHFTLYALSEQEETPPTTQPEESAPTKPSEETQPVQPALPSSGNYVIWDVAFGAALSSQRSREGSEYFKNVPVTQSETGLSGYGNSEIWTITIADSALTIACGSETLGMKATFPGIGHADGDTHWIAEEGNGGWYLKNAGCGWYIRYDHEFSRWTACEDMGQASLLKLTPAQALPEPEEPTQPEESTVPEEIPAAPVTMTPDGGELFIKDSHTTVTLSCETEGAVIHYATSPDGVTYSEHMRYAAPLVILPGFGKLYVKAYAEAEGFAVSEETLRSFTERTSAGAGLYFGQLHSHSDLSDGLGSVQEAFAHAANVEHLDFLAVTDHSNSFGQTGWETGKAAAIAATDWDFVALYGYEMTWEEGKQLGHINTFNTTGFFSREQPEFSDYTTALPNYYAAVASLPGSVSQFNHPGDTFGDFQDFGHYSEAADRAVTLLELGQTMDVSYYIQALDAGWHVAPTCNQNNHSGSWGDADNGRTAVFANSLTEAGIYDALRNYRVYATEDYDLSIVFTLNGSAMGSQLEKRHVGETVQIAAAITDPTDGAAATVEVITEGGKVLQTLPANSGQVSFPISAGYPYYFLRVTQPDGDTAVTAPIWADTTEDVGISEFSSDTAVPVQNEVLNLTLKLYNNESCDLLVEKITFTMNGETIHETGDIPRVMAGSTAGHTFPVKLSALGQQEIKVTVTATLEGQPRTYEKTLSLNFHRSDLVSRIIVDAAHGNAGVTQLQNLTAIAAEDACSVTVCWEGITPEMLGNAKLLIVSAPTKPFEEDFLELVRDFAEAGGTIVVCGQSDGADSTVHTAGELNRLLAAAGSSLRLRDDTARDLQNSGDSAYDIFPANFNMTSKWCAGITENQVYSHRSGSTVDVGGGTWLVKGHPTTDSVDADGDGLATAAMGEAVFLACEGVGGGTVFAAGTLFLSDTDTAGLKNIWDEPYANRTILRNLLGSAQKELALSTIGAVRSGVPGEIYRIRGYVTAGTSDPYNTFPNTLYLQDDTGGIAVVPFTAAGIEIGTPIEIIGALEIQGGNPVLRLTGWDTLSLSFYRYAPETIPNRDAMNYALRGGQLLQISGKVVEVTLSGTEGVSRFVLEDGKGDLATVLIEPSILSGSTGKNTLASQVKQGRTVRAMGISHIHSDGTTVLRVRNCDEVVYVPPLAYTPNKEQDNPQTEDELVLYLLAIPLTATALILLKRKKEETK